MAHRPAAADDRAALRLPESAETICAQTTIERPPAILTAFDREMAAFLVRWEPYGGPPDDEAFPLFGMSTDDLVNRIYEIALACRRSNLRAEDRWLLMRATVAATRWINRRRSSCDQDAVRDPDQLSLLDIGVADGLVQLEDLGHDV